MPNRRSRMRAGGEYSRSLRAGSRAPPRRAQSKSVYGALTTKSRAVNPDVSRLNRGRHDALGASKFFVLTTNEGTIF